MRGGLFLFLIPAVALAQDPIPAPAAVEASDLAAEAPAKPAAETIAILPFVVEGLQGHSIRRLDLLLRARVANRSGLQLLDELTTSALVESVVDLGFDCELSLPSCAAEFGVIADVQHVLLGRASGLDEGRTGLHLQLVNVGTGEVSAEVNALLYKDSGKRMQQLGRAATALFDETRERLASIQLLSVKPEGVVVAVDGAQRAVVPSELPIRGLLSGKHEVTFQLDGYKTRAQEVSVGPGDVVQMSIILEPGLAPRRKSSVERSLPWGIAASGGLMAVAGGAAMLVGSIPALDAASAKSQLDALPPGSSYGAAAQPLNDRMVGDHESFQTWGAPALISGAIVAGAGAIISVGGLVFGTMDLAEGEMVGE